MDGMDRPENCDVERRLETGFAHVSCENYTPSSLKQFQTLLIDGLCSGITG